MSKARPKRETVAQLTYFVVQPFKEAKGAPGKVSADEAVPAHDYAHAMRMFERFKQIRAGVIAFRRTGSPATGDWEDAVIIARHGIVPDDVDAMADESAADFESWDVSENDLKVA